MKFFKKCCCWATSWLFAMPGTKRPKQRDVPLDLGYRVLPMGDYNVSAYTISGKQLRNLPVTIFRSIGRLVTWLFCPTSARWWISE